MPSGAFPPIPLGMTTLSFKEKTGNRSFGSRSFLLPARRHSATAKQHKMCSPAGSSSALCTASAEGGTPGEGPAALARSGAHRHREQGRAARGPSALRLLSPSAGAASPLSPALTPGLRAPRPPLQPARAQHRPAPRRAAPREAGGRQPRRAAARWARRAQSAAARGGGPSGGGSPLRGRGAGRGGPGPRDPHPRLFRSWRHEPGPAAAARRLSRRAAVTSVAGDARPTAPACASARRGAARCGAVRARGPQRLPREGRGGEAGVRAGPSGSRTRGGSALRAAEQW